MAKVIMIQGTMSNAGKSWIVAGLCRIFKQDGYKVAPFKSQNMALNSYITEEGHEMGRAQVVQAEACGIKPKAVMNPILLKPTTDMGSQVIVRGKVLGDMKAMDYYKKKKDFIPVVKEAYEELASQYDIVVIEGAGSPAEINLKEDDLVNMGMAKLADAPVLLVGDIDRGGVFAQLVGTILLLDEDEQDRIKGLIINKFRGDKTILEPGIKMLEEKAGKKVLGVVPYRMDIKVEDEDSLAGSLEKKTKSVGKNILDVAIVRLPKISNFTDFQALCLEPQMSVRYIDSVDEFGNPDLLILPGTKSTIADMAWLIESGLETMILRYANDGGALIGICGGYQMLGKIIKDEDQAEGNIPLIRGLGLLPIKTNFSKEKVQEQRQGVMNAISGLFADLSGKQVSGYEIHMGNSVGVDDGMKNAISYSTHEDGYAIDNIFGCYLHGLFDEVEFRKSLVKLLCVKKQIPYEDTEEQTYDEYKEQQFDALADMLRESLDMKAIYEAMGL